ncbi:hypothetical protein BAU15_09400 [Enterococcus sp. JM4C]|uniref:MerR family transcriptional regulator n=1 Tax=Candidatus Enterococcus huntleyi TaxID=1857217 RepID=UPI00137B5CB1|nr:MerR family transcriptional regulator [Enterococcus sp. JM4C]KAF1298056.1 hypothetical protein BAU15_09400 [Enterococcus sp. JM4C]
MTISEFVRQQNTTIDTVKHYLKLGLLTPDKKNSWYDFSAKEVEDFQNIVELKALGLSLEVIKQIKESHETNCGTAMQWQENLAVIEGELDRVNREKGQLATQEAILVNVQQALQRKLAE